MKKVIAMALCGLALSGCATDYKGYLAAQQSANELAMREQKPLVRLEAHPGQTISGLAKLEVYAPQAVPVIQQERPSEWAGVLNTALGVTGSALGIKLGGDAAIGLAGAVGRAATTGYGHIQAPGAVTTTTTTSTIGDNSGANSGNSGRLAGGDLTDSTHVPTVVTAPDPVIVQQAAPPVVTQ